MVSFSLCVRKERVLLNNVVCSAHPGGQRALLCSYTLWIFCRYQLVKGDAPDVATLPKFHLLPSGSRVERKQIK